MKSDPNNRLITLTVIPISGVHFTSIESNCFACYLIPFSVHFFRWKYSMLSFFAARLETFDLFIYRASKRNEVFSKLSYLGLVNPLISLHLSFSLSNTNTLQVHFTPFSLILSLSFVFETLSFVKSKGFSCFILN